jgi:PAS domain S-box-containing protein
MKDQQNKLLLRKQPMLLLSFAVFILIISGGYFYYRYEKKIIRQEQYNNLKTIADLKINQITKWREERLADAQVIAEGSFIRQNFQRWLISHDSTLGKYLLERFSLLRYNHKYEDAIIVSDGGRLLLSLNSSSKHIDSETIDYCNKTLQDKKAFLSDLYFSPAHDTIHFDIFAPILDDKNVALAVLVLRVNPYDYLYPLIQSWPTSSKSAETLIIRKEGDSTLYENELRHISNTALRLRIPLTSIKVPAVQAVLGHVGIFEGSDYRGVRVLSDIRPVPGTPWFMIAKVDQSEIFSEITYRTVIVIVITLLLLLFFGIGISWLYNNQQKNIYRKLLETGAALKASEVKFSLLFENAQVGMYRSKLDGFAIQTVNSKFCEIFGYTKEEMLNNPATIHWFEPGAYTKMVENLHKNRFLHNYEIDIHTKSEEIRNLLISATLYPDQELLEGTAIDITERKRAEEALRASEIRYRSYIEVTGQVGWVTNANGEIDEDVPSLRKFSGQTYEEAKGSGWAKAIHPDDLENTIQVWDKAVTMKSFYEVEYRMRRHDGVYRLLLARGFPIFNEDESIREWVGTCIDITERKRAEVEIRDNEKRFRELIESLPQLLWTCRVDGPCDYLSKQWVEYTGVPEAEQLGYRWLEQLHSEDRDNAVSGWMDKVKTGERFDIEFRIRRNDGLYHWFKTTAVPMRDSVGNITKWFGSNTDIDGLKKAEEQLRKLNHIYSLLSDINQAIVRTREPKELYEKVCNIAVEQGGFGMTWIGLVDETSQKLEVIAKSGRTDGYHKCVSISLKSKPLSYCPIDNALRNGKHDICKIIENEEMDPCQKIIYDLGFRSSASFQLMVSGVVKGVLTFYSYEPDFFDEAELKLLDELALDISFAMEYAEKEARRKLAEETLRIKNQVFENSIASQSIADSSGRITYVNQAFLRLWGYSCKDQAIGNSVASFFDDQADAVPVLEALEAYDVWEGEFRAKRTDGTAFISRGFATSLHDTQGKLIGYQSTNLDVTKEREAEEKIILLNTELEDRVAKRTSQLETLNKELEAFSYSVSHDLRAPLRHVSGYVELLNKHFQSDLPEKGQHYLNSIADSVHVMGVLIDDLLQFSRSGRTKMQQSDFDMNEIVNEVKESLSKDNPDRKIEWVFGELPFVNGDKAMLRLVWMNLLSNAVKFTYTKKKARIEIGVHEENQELVFFVRDNGVGFDMQYAQKLFGVFQRLHRSEEFEGTGIGLANVRRIVIRHGGRTWAEAEIDKGAVFYFSIPN